MLLITRDTHKSKVKIGEDIYIDVIKIGNGRVQLAISAPIDMAIVREEHEDFIKDCQQKNSP